MDSDTGIRLNDPVFVFGAARSGTSLLSRMLNSHPNIAVPFESHIYKLFYRWQRFYGDLEIEFNRAQLVADILNTTFLSHWVPRPDKDRVMATIERNDFGGVFEGIIRGWAETNGADTTLWGEKSPSHAYFWPEITAAFPRARILHIVRDGRDVAMSLKRARFGAKNYYKLGEYWVKYLETVQDASSAVPRQQFLEVRYEDLVEDTVAKLDEICRFLGVSYQRNMLEYHRNEKPYSTDKRNLRNLARPIISGNTDKWRSALSRRDLETFESIAGTYLQEYGYELSAPVRPTSAGDVCLYTVLHPLQRCWAMIRNTVGYREALNTASIRMRMFLRYLGVSRRVPA